MAYACEEAISGCPCPFRGLTAQRRRNEALGGQIGLDYPLMALGNERQLVKKCWLMARATTPSCGWLENVMASQRISSA